MFAVVSVFSHFDDASFFFVSAFIEDEFTEFFGLEVILGVLFVGGLGAFEVSEGGSFFASPFADAVFVGYFLAVSFLDFLLGLVSVFVVASIAEFFIGDLVIVEAFGSLIGFWV